MIPGSSGTQDPLQFAEALSEEADATALYRVFTDVLVGDDPTPEVLLAQAQLAFAAQNMQAARKAAQRALQLDSGLTEARSIELRAQSVLGEHEAAIAGARQLDPASLSGEDVFLLAICWLPPVARARPARNCSASRRSLRPARCRSSD